MMYCFSSDDEKTESHEADAVSSVISGKKHHISTTKTEPTWNMMYCFASDDEETESVVFSDVATEKCDVSIEKFSPCTTTTEEDRLSQLPSVESCVRG